jgi:hypothetical protein
MSDEGGRRATVHGFRSSFLDWAGNDRSRECPGAGPVIVWPVVDPVVAGLPPVPLEGPLVRRPQSVCAGSGRRLRRVSSTARIVDRIVEATCVSRIGWHAAGCRCASTRRSRIRRTGSSASTCRRAARCAAGCPSCRRATARRTAAGTTAPALRERVQG